MKHTRKCKHIRTSKRGRKFYAGRGQRKVRRAHNEPRMIEITPSGKYPDVQWAPRKSMTLGEAQQKYLETGKPFIFRKGKHVGYGERE